MNIFNAFHSRTPGPRVEMVRHDLKHRWLRVESVAPLTPGMLRITFSGDDLGDFASLAFDDHVKIFAPSASGGIEPRDYTPRRYDRQSRTLVIDFAVHDAGPATRWALGARPGDRLQIGGPRGSKVIVADDVRRWLLIGDETALPAIGRQIEEAGQGVEVTSIVGVVDPRERQDFATRARLTTFWAYRPLPTADDPRALLAVLDAFELPPRTFVWIAAEAKVARALRNHFIEERGHPSTWIKAAGYWVKGRADAHEPIQ
jgi:NADPH-dependent ferric siderophore reductase